MHPLSRLQIFHLNLTIFVDTAMTFVVESASVVVACKFTRSRLWLKNKKQD